MLKLFVSLLLIVKVITTSDNCGKRCSTSDLAIEEFPETNEDIQKLCKPYIAYMECEIHQEEICPKHDPRSLQMGYRVLSTVREVCSEDTLLHAAVVDNLKCFGKLMKEDNRECHMHESQSEHVQQLAEALNEEGLLSLPGDENYTNNLYPCVGLMSLFACHSLVIEGACGTIAMDAYVEILQKIKPLGVFHISCEESYNLLPAVIRLRKAEEEKEHTIAAIFGERK